MKLNQFAFHQVSSEQLYQDLVNIKLLDESDKTLSSLKLFQKLIAGIFPEYHSLSSCLEALRYISVDSQHTLADIFNTEPFHLSRHQFIIMVLQLLKFEIGIDFQMDNAEVFYQDCGYPKLSFDQINDSETLLRAFYLLLNLRTKNGMNFLDDLANRGFFNSFFDAQAPHFVFFNNRVQAVFDASKTIREIVYVESDLDTDHDGKHDLLEATIFRPAATDRGLKVPTLYTANPYFKGTNDMTPSLHNVNQNLQPKKAQIIDKAEIQATHTLAYQPIGAKASEENHDTEISAQAETVYSLNDYFLSRGFASVYAAGIGTRHSDGLRTTGSQEETASTIAIIQWLHGDRIAYTNRTDHIPTTAWWCNGNVAMTGKSYLGTLATAAATTGVTGLKAIISESAISSWYDYYRDNGLVVAPEDCQGEDTDVLAIDTFSRLKDDADFQKIKAVYERQQQALTVGQDRDTGNYNTFWDERNYRNDVKHIQCAVLIVHGLNDWNVKLRNPEKLWRALRAAKIPAKIFLHQGQHIYMNNIRSIDFNDMVNYWLVDKLCHDQKNASDADLPKVLIQDNVTPEQWHHYQDWCAESAPIKQFYLQKNQLTTKPKPTETQSFIDNGTTDFLKHNQTEHQWQNALLSQTSEYQHNRLLFLTDPLTKDLYIDGNPIVTLQVAVDSTSGKLSVMLADYGIARRLQAQPSIVGRGALQLGFNNLTEDLKEFQLETHPSPFKLITKGHINMQNRRNNWSNDVIQPGNFYTVRFELQPTHYHLLTNHQLGLIVYSTDMGMTLRESRVQSYTLDLNASRLEIPYNK
ncbi:Xaa-Pro dipeptidyl-peptidase [Lactobacillus sp. CC-MHH1034]|uniref:Xaa-Pro dipeptidyl-peptidase n=1 Tax=Agrilactobacillus fermenti TaxID=2586909 RepID=UPI001E640BE8|nr:Xaa-Pro dipeptidyl-peptidase [Agrilactobacillus fermenti]MCD2256192.1 Xaa-Pro dipeptidyl-peptidase [Agrilactobacillus fermenti]